MRLDSGKRVQHDLHTFFVDGQYTLDRLYDLLLLVDDPQGSAMLRRVIAHVTSTIKEELLEDA